jgi:hypothetical protein
VVVSSSGVPRNPRDGYRAIPRRVDGVLLSAG